MEGIAGETAIEEGEPRRTDPLSFIVKAAVLLPQLALPTGFAYFSVTRDMEAGGIGRLSLILLLIAALIALNLGIAWLQWRRFTYRVGEADIRVESGLLSRSARSVPYERIQDVSLEQKFVARLLGLVEVRFETGAGGKDELALAYLSQEQGEALREVVRERRDEADGVATDAADTAEEATINTQEQARPLFAMGPGRLFTFGLFEFSLALVAVLAAAAQQLDFLLPFDLWDPDFWMQTFAGPGERIAGAGPVMQFVGVMLIAGTLVIAGMVTGLVRTFLRDWDFRLDRTAKGFRRRRGLFTRTDVVMPAHRVQALRFTTGIMRRRFGWQGLKFISLAQDSGAGNHVVAPFARDAELLPIAHAAGFTPPPGDTAWKRASRAYRIITAIAEAGALIALGVAIEIALFVFEINLFDGQEWAALIPVAIGVAAGIWQWFLWRYERHALGTTQIYVRTGWLAPALDIGRRVKLQSVEIAQGPFARRFGFATLHLGLAGGKLAVPGIPVDRAREWRAAILDSIATSDFSELV